MTPLCAHEYTRDQAPWPGPGAQCPNDAEKAGLCRTHYNQQWRTRMRDAKRGRPWSPPVRGHCGIRKCESPHYAHGRCRAHYMRWRRRRLRRGAWPPTARRSG